MSFKIINGIEIFRPNENTKTEYFISLSEFLLKNFGVGEYTSCEDVKKILDSLLTFCSERLGQALDKIASFDLLKDLLEFSLAEYDKATEIKCASQKDHLTEKDFWISTAPVLRRALKYIAEEITRFPEVKAKKQPRNQEYMILVEKVWLYAEEMVGLYTQRDTTLFEDKFRGRKFIIYPLTEKCVYHFDSGENHDNGLPKLVEIDTRVRSQFFPDEKSYLHDVEKHDQYLAQPLQNGFGFTYKQALQVLLQIITGSVPSHEKNTAIILEKKLLLASCCEHFKLLEKIIEKILSGFTLTDKNMEGRLLHKPKQEYRAFRRGFFEVLIDGKIWIAFSKKMAKEAFEQLVEGVPFKEFPTEWKNKDIEEKTLSKISGEQGKWFEKIASYNFEKLGIIGRSSLKKQVGNRKNVLNIPQEVGEIDFLGYSPQDEAIIIAEFKMTRFTTEARFFLEEYNKYIKNKQHSKDKSYLRKFSKKIGWIKDNLEAVVEAMRTHKALKNMPNVQKVYPIMITYYPTYIHTFIEEFPCKSLALFMKEYQENGRWDF